MKILSAILLLGFPLAAAAATGAWTGSSYGTVISQGHQPYSSLPVKAPATVTAQTTPVRLAWRVKTDRPVPVGFRMEFCDASQCIDLHSLAGERSLPQSFHTTGPFWFRYLVQSRGPVFPKVTVLKNEVTINYRYNS